ncbi:MAG: insulinase family protein [SAR324 cluster bacterium]|nr:insulinase family protein [SAR324 cluster bacterium]
MKYRCVCLFVILFVWQSVTFGASDKTDPRYKQRHYRRLVLENKIKVLLISDPTSDQAAASLSVGAGSLNDPPEHQGMAHFLEHMLFLGTKKYPAVDDYKNYIASHDGYSNAFTGTEYTNYHFQVSNDYLEGALDRFSQFFIAPLFNPKFVEREMQAVDSEFSKNRQNDYWRISQVERSLYAANHPARMFHIGNSETLGQTTQEELLKFYHSHYSANLMNLVVLGKENLDTLQNWVETYFHDIKNLDLPPFTFPQKYLSKSNQLRLLRIKPVKDSRTLQLTFPLPSVRHRYDSKPSQLLGFLIGHEGTGSLLSLLKKEGLATGLSAGGHSQSSYGTFRISIQLTPQGLKNYKTVITRVFQYIRLLRKTGLPLYVYDEVQKMAEIDYRFQEKEEGTGLVIDLAAMLHYVPLPVVEIDPYLYKKYDPDLFDSLLFRLTPDNMLVSLIARDQKTRQREPYYGTAYSYVSNDRQLIRQLKRVRYHPELKIPEKNIFIPEKLAVDTPDIPFGLSYQSIAGLKQDQVPSSVLNRLMEHQGQRWNSWQDFQTLVFPDNPKEAGDLRKLMIKHALVLPEKILDNPQGTVWFQQDIRFGTPKAQLTLLLHTPEVYKSARSAVLSQLYVNAIEEGLNEFGYMVHLAGLNYGLSAQKKGVTLNISGYSDRILDLTQTLADKLKKIIIDDTTFDAVKDQQVRLYQNFQFNQPYQQAWYFQNLLLEEKKFSIDQYQKEIETITLRELQDYAQKLYRTVYVEGVVYGNLMKSEAEKTIEGFLAKIDATPLSPSEKFVDKIVQLKGKNNYIYSKKASVDNSAIYYGIQVGKTSPRLRGALLIISKALRPWTYTELRTQQQLGYIVEGGMSQIEKTLSWMFVVQSGKYPAGLLQQKISKYIPEFIEKFKKMSDDDFEVLRQSVITAKLEKATTSTEEAGRIYYAAFEKDANFDYVSEDIQAVENLTRNEVNQILEKYLSPEYKHRLVVRMVGQSHQDTPVMGTLIDSVEQFKQGQKAGSEH